jgi:DNA-binding protein
MPEEEKVEKPKVEAKPKREENVIYVGRKPAMAYVLGVITQFSEGQKEVKLKARGRAISRAVDVAEIVRKRFVQDVQVKSITTGTEERELEDGTKINISTIDITLAK